MSFAVNQSLSVNQRRNARLNEYFAVVGLPDGPLTVADSLLGGTGTVSTVPRRTPSFSSAWKVQTKVGSATGGFSTDSEDDEETTEDEGDLDSPPPTVAGGGRPTLQRKHTYGSYELGTVRPRMGGMEMGGEEESPLTARYRTKVLHRYPAYDHEGSAFPTNLSLFCLPGGLKLSVEMMLPTFFTFVHTRANGQHMFGYCLCLYEALTESHRLELQRMMDAHDAARRPRRHSGLKEGGIGMGACLTARGGMLPGQSGTVEETSPPATLDPSRTVYAPKCLCLLSTWPYFGPFREWFLSLYRISLSPSKIPLERYIGNFLLEVPTPSPGRVEVLYNMGNATIAFACPPPNKPVAWGSVPFEPLFQCLSHQNVITVFSCLLLERSLLLKSSQLSLLTTCAEVLTLLLYPLCWTHVYIPILPEALLGVLAAPMPFLMGVHRSFLEDTGMDLPPNVVQVDLDNDVVDMGTCSRLPSLPWKRRSKLLAKLARHADLSHCRTPEYREDVMQKSDLAFSMALRPCDFDEDDETTPEPPDWDAVREAFLRFFVALLSGYRRFLVYPTKQDPNPMSLFSVEDYLDKLERDSRPFAELMCNTQAFQNFVDARIQPEEGDLDIVFFDACIAAKKNRSMRSFVKKDANFLRPDTYVKAKTVYALTPDTSGLDMTAPPTVHERFPTLSAALYPIPRDIPSLSTPALRSDSSGSNHVHKPGESGGFGRVGGRGSVDGDGGYAGDNGGVRRNGEGGVSTGGRGVFRMGSSRGADLDWSVLPAEATVFAVFIVGFCAIIGIDPPPGRKGAVSVRNGATVTASGPPGTVLPPPVQKLTPINDGTDTEKPAAALEAATLDVANNSAENHLSKVQQKGSPAANTTDAMELPSAAPSTLAPAAVVEHDREQGSAAAGTPADVPVNEPASTLRLSVPSGDPVNSNAESAAVKILLVEREDVVNARPRDTVIAASGGVAVVLTGGDPAALPTPAEGNTTGRGSPEAPIESDVDMPPTLTPLTGASVDNPSVVDARNTATSYDSSAVADCEDRSSANEAALNDAATEMESMGDTLPPVAEVPVDDMAHVSVLVEDDGRAVNPVHGDEPSMAKMAADTNKVTANDIAPALGGVEAGNGSLDSGSSTSPPSIDLGPSNATPVVGVTKPTTPSGRGELDSGEGTAGVAGKSPGAAVSTAEPSRKSLGRLAFSELQHDMKEERLYKANEALKVAFEALEAMRQKAPAAEEAVYRSLISACGRCGNSEKAIAVVEMMMSTGIVPDAMVSRCLVDAFAMDDTFMGGGAHPLALLDWSKFQPRRHDGRRAPEPHAGRTDTTFSFKKFMKRFDKSDAPSRPAAAAAAAAAPPPPPPPPMSQMALPKLASSSTDEEHGGSSRPPSYSTFLATFTLAGSRSADADGETGATVTNSCHGHSRGRSSGSGRGESEEDRKRSANLRRRLERSASPYTSRGGMSLAMQQQVLLGERMLESLFPELKIENKGETCPSCNVNLAEEDVRQGWTSDPNDYTTRCRAWLDPQAAAAKANTRVPASGWGAKSGGSGTAPGSGNGNYRTPKPSFVTCGRRFVPRFSVRSTAEGWQGTTGPGTPLWCEYLSPWVLRKEFHTVLAAYGVQYLCSARFRHGLGPVQDGFVGLGGVAGGSEGVDVSGGAGTTVRTVDRTIFWNLVVHFREHCLPIIFLLEEEAAAGIALNASLD